ncbi:P-loop containing nucleoside triphosphate hydrolase protein [Pisolithus marmoratus]|nr:P-loop containing nucleoside triphosphate hydrolase protein [Pisolithus marmoratus]
MEFDTDYPKPIAAAAKEREKAQKVSQQRKGTGSSGYTTPVSRAMSPVTSPVKSVKRAAGVAQTSKRTGDGISSKQSSGGADQKIFDIAALNLTSKEEAVSVDEPPPKMTLERGKLLEDARKVLEGPGKNGKRSVSLVVIGHVDAGKSTLMGRLLYELGHVDEKTRVANERGSSKVGKSSFSWAWGLDETTEERERGITMDIALQSLTTPHRQITILDAPGHKDFIPNMISGASQADCALLVVDAATGEFEAGFDRGGQTREHILLVRSLGVSQVIVAVNKLDQVDWAKSRYEEICRLLKAFLGQSGFHSSKIGFVPVAAMLGVNLVDRSSETTLTSWYKGPTLVDLLDKLEPPVRDIDSPLRIPISNVFKGQSSGTGVSGRICGGIVQVGERVRVLPGDETAVVRSIEVDEINVPWAAAGSNATLYLVAIDPIHLTVGSILCPPGNLVPLATTFSARIIVFDIQVPITVGASIELFHHSRDVPATLSKLVAAIDRASGSVVKKNPRQVSPPIHATDRISYPISFMSSVLSRGSSAEVEITLRGGTLSAPSTTARAIPLEPFSVNKDMGRILVRRGGETIAAGIVLNAIA